MIQLPDDVKAAGYIQTDPFQVEQVFSSQSANFTGTEKQFVQVGKAYGYIQIDRFSRCVVPVEIAITSYQVEHG